ncbi:acetyl-CoA carboxylase biotin carboxyl carrier protein [Clostridium amazonitimonense]|uniref:acetyl-CoA carboxylase biotin carboxyl carrier protein n=1 Tax=Clostridium amazonitimonense TaxID=1499689 RepID=UPI000509DAA0|nr:acetyl-CoA carboxylase biotin carboxyl carrier protein [Clostridium amazonitimonense]
MGLNLDLESLLRIIDRVDNSSIALFEIKTEEAYIKLDKSKEERKEICKLDEDINFEIEDNSISLTTNEKIFGKDKDSEGIKKETRKEEILEEEYAIIKSPMVGTFYSAPTPEEPSFVKRGDTIKKGQVICIIEAMKLMNEIESEFNGEVVEVLVENNNFVEYGEALFKIRKEV